MSPPLLAAPEALARILAECTPLPAELAGVQQALGRVLAMDLAAARTQPPLDNSAMDGYAVRAADCQETPAPLKVVDRLFAGVGPGQPLGPGQAVRIMTGAPIPPGADAVVMQERTRLDGSTVQVLERPSPGHNIRPAGEDAREGQLLLEAGSVIGLAEAALVWGQGIPVVPVFRRPRVGVLSTGDELGDPAAPLPGQILDSNGPMLTAAAARAGAEAIHLGRCLDDPDALRAALEAARHLDVLITSAGASVGERDLVRGVLQSLGAQERFWRLAIKPGKPLAWARWGNAHVFSLPGNPVSALVTFELFVRPALRKLAGHPAPAPGELPGRTAVALRKAAGLRHYLRATVSFRDGTAWATPLPTQGSGALRSAAQATHLLVLPEDVTERAPGDPVGLVPLNWLA
ncbi:MAG: molybdopterin molybdotransferase MoeA [Deltaproteobacteria bacterium]|nr:molybdopterin molybdotransferase MoeA [Deltaproteobacteria bacterium]